MYQSSVYSTVSTHLLCMGDWLTAWLPLDKVQSIQCCIFHVCCLAVWFTWLNVWLELWLADWRLTYSTPRVSDWLTGYADRLKNWWLTDCVPKKTIIYLQSSVTAYIPFNKYLSRYVYDEISILWRHSLDCLPNIISCFSSALCRFSIRQSIHQSIRQSIHPSVHPSVNPSVNPSVHPSFNPSVHPSVHTSVNQLVHPSVNPSVNQLVHPSVHTSVNPSVHKSVSPSISQSVSQCMSGN